MGRYSAEWVSVFDRLPELVEVERGYFSMAPKDVKQFESRRVLAVMRGEVHEAVLRRTEYGNRSQPIQRWVGMSPSSPSGRDDEVTHWCDLPEVPEETRLEKV